MLYSARVAALLLVATLATRADAQVPTTSKGDVTVPDRINADQLRAGMRRLWVDHVIWTREYIVNTIEADPSVDAATSRLMKNQVDIGTALVPFYGKAVGDSLTVLLKQHIVIAGELVAASRALSVAKATTNEDNAKVLAADQRWRANAIAIATLLSSVNPYWPMNDLNAMLNEHLTLTALEGKTRLDRNYSEDVATFDRILTQSLVMANALSEGIIKQFPNK
jgi:hypothetical protein